MMMIEVGWGPGGSVGCYGMDARRFAAIQMDTSKFVCPVSLSAGCVGNTLAPRSVEKYRIRLCAY